MLRRRLDEEGEGLLRMMERYVMCILKNYGNADMRYLDCGQNGQQDEWMCEDESLRGGKTGKSRLPQEEPDAFSISSTTRWNSATSSFGMGYVCSGAG